MTTVIFCQIDHVSTFGEDAENLSNLSFQQSQEEVLSLQPITAITAQAAADYISRGMSKKKYTIIFPFSTRILWWTAMWIPAKMALF
ncbi:hypothetical protein N9139_00050 [Akkermansiaceae bacterium]|nr:hypothetical protein [Akkermansiaceae bacterium]